MTRAMAAFPDRSSPEPPEAAPFVAGFVALPGTRWHLWRTVALNGAGFPLRLVDRLADPARADAADRVVRSARTAHQGRSDPGERARWRWTPTTR